MEGLDYNLHDPECGLSPAGTDQRKHRGVALRSCHTGALFYRVTKKYGSYPISEEIPAPLMTL